MTLFYISGKLFCHLADNGCLVAVSTNFRIAAKKYCHHLICCFIAAGIFQSAQQIGHQFTEIGTLGIVRNSSLMECTRFYQIRFNIIRQRLTV